MNSGLNKVYLVGYVTREPRWHHFKNNRYLCFTIATAEVIKSQSGINNHEELHNIKIEADKMSHERHFPSRGDMVYIQGKLHTYSFVDESNVKRYKTDVMVINIEPFKP
ncbi:single-stranded DNA-binding protein [Mucilaginibacter limnophilus]|uniref:Single-stranded DNA-binding protein n=1 Tax=Mucilaginibacter limnophilus TaxID=1932778 RepID=A0A437MXQ9_9SPHI|nr:single-stranded DNA-binding protein [Mucilaginibacter limnophilus]RVU02450.1 single-stranded DNA-binding protein [Mucilaginibacter limnophilus]